MNGTIFVWLLTTVLLGTVSALAQQPTKIPRIGFLFFGSNDQPHLESFRQGLRDLGYVEGKNIAIEYRYAEGKPDALPALAAVARSQWPPLSVRFNPRTRFVTAPYYQFKVESSKLKVAKVLLQSTILSFEL